MSFFCSAALGLIGFFIISLCYGQKNPDAVSTLPAEPGLETVVVVGYSKTAKASYARLLAGLAIFEQKHKISPKSELFFQAQAVTQPLSMPLLTIRLENEQKSIILHVDEAGRFKLPNPDEVGVSYGDIVSNRRSGDLKIRPLVQSPGTTDERRRLGDLRLQCEVGWAIEKEDVPFLVRTAFQLAGGVCGSSQIAVYFQTARKIREASLITAERHMPILVGRDGYAYAPPLFDASWPDDTIVALSFEEALPPSVSSKVPTQ